MFFTFYVTATATGNLPGRDTVSYQRGSAWYITCFCRRVRWDGSFPRRPFLRRYRERGAQAGPIVQGFRPGVARSHAVGSVSG